MAGVTRTIVLAVLMLFLGSAVADEIAPPLYESVAIVTGQREETRVPGIRQCFLDVLAKVSGDSTLLGDAGVAKLAEGAGAFVVAYRYHDRLWKRPIHDEQGTRDRPHDLTVDFDPARIDAALRSVGRQPWTAHRPTVAVFVAVEQGPSTYVTSTDGPHGFGQADAFLSAGTRTGIDVVVPSEGALASNGLSYEAVRDADSDRLDGAAAGLGAEVPLAATMRFSDADLGWTVDWRFVWRGRPYRWSVRGVNFDAAFLNGLRGVAQIASGHGRPS